MLLAKQLRRHIVNGKNVKTVHQYIKKLVTMRHAANTIMDLHNTAIVIKTHVTDFQTEYLTNRIASVTSVFVKIRLLLKIFTT